MAVVRPIRALVQIAGLAVPKCPGGAGEREPRVGVGADGDRVAVVGSGLALIDVITRRAVALIAIVADTFEAAIGVGAGGVLRL